MKTAKLAASKAGELIMANQGAVAVAHTKDGDKDLVTLIDKQCEEASQFPRSKHTGIGFVDLRLESKAHCSFPVN